MVTSGIYEHKPFSEEHKRKISKSKKGQIPWNKDKIMPKEFREKVSKSKKGKPNGRLGTHHLEETKKKISENSGKFWLGKHRSRKTKQKIKEGNLDQYPSEEVKRRMSESHKGKRLTKIAKKKISGENNGNWQGGISNEPYPFDFNEELKELIRQRDNYTCQLCGIHQDELKGWNRKLDVHHKDYDKDNLDPDNLITLCRSCHIKTNTNREYWIDYFNDIELRGE